MIPIYAAFISSARENTCFSNLLLTTQVRHSALSSDIKYVCTYILISKILYLYDTNGLRR